MDDLVRIASGLVASALGAAALFMTVKIARQDYRALTLSPEGFRDTNIAREVVPWSAVTSMSVAPTYFRGRQQFLAIDLKVKDSAWSALTLTRSAKINKRHGGNMWVSRVGKERDFNAFFAMMRAYTKAHGGTVD
ncbi:hypothetical protein RB623_24060 [Mesorhizobium sp. LHD-90]|uniref:hypothetical protein n=1 Tax=Mesorhizobium sp. LHD-90 TaxID=3071414 RepID=UPI0027E073F7|nr:hypothetical protein [Mesorhizobium sp. LHD-90]MDQ6437140.1 hypothetical protein [Mesorhizobium sp. LHD-90]